MASTMPFPKVPSLVLSQTKLHTVEQKMPAVPWQNMALQQFQQVTSANMPHIHIGIFLETIRYIYTVYTVCVQTNQIVLSTVCILQFMKLCSVQRMDLQ